MITIGWKRDWQVVSDNTKGKKMGKKEKKMFQHFSSPFLRTHTTDNAVSR